MISPVDHPAVYGPLAPERPAGRIESSNVSIRLRSLIEDIVADVFDIDARQLRHPTRGRARIALARQVAMYIAHVGYGLSLTQAGQLFDRDRTTVSHACSVVEQRRDDLEFDRAVLMLELIVRALAGSGGSHAEVSPVQPQGTPTFDLPRS